MVVHETTKFQYVKWDDKYLNEKPYRILFSSPSEHNSVPQTNIVLEQSEWEEDVTDIRENPSTYTLDTNGFSVHTVESDFSSWFDQEKVETEYIPQVVEPFLRQHVREAAKIIVFDWHVCVSTADSWTS
jgi:hypothetical protein